MQNGSKKYWKWLCLESKARQHRYNCVTANPQMFQLQVAHCKDNHFVFRKVFMEQHSCQIALRWTNSRKTLQRISNYMSLVNNHIDSLQMFFFFHNGPLSENSFDDFVLSSSSLTRQTLPKYSSTFKASNLIIRIPEPFSLFPCHLTLEGEVAAAVIM